MRQTTSLCTLLALACSVGTVAQQVMIDRGVRARGLWCFPTAANPSVYVYLPSKATLATDQNGEPEFSFLRYIVNTAAAEASTASITEAKGGGIIHMLVEYETAEDAIAEARAELRKILDDDEIVLRGPIVFRSGRYSLVSSIVGEDGASGRHLLASGKAPVLEGNRIALSFDLSPKQATLLDESFRMATPDLSLVFDMTFGGLTDAYEAELVVHWDRVKESEAFAAGGQIYVVSADVRATFETLRDKSAIELSSSGSDASMEALLTTVYEKLLDLMFDKVEPESVPIGQRAGLMTALSSIGGGTPSESGTGGIGFGLNVGYQLKDLRSTHDSVLDFNHRSFVERASFITFNIGDLHRRYGSDPERFRTVNLGDDAFQQRQIQIGVDGDLVQEFGDFVNSVTVTVRKRHAAGKVTAREAVITRDSLGTRLPRFVYGWDGDHDRIEWLRYEYRTAWSFRGGANRETEWQETSTPMINLHTPFERRAVQLVGGREALTAQGIHAVHVKLTYDFFGEPKSVDSLFRVDADKPPEVLEITMPAGQTEFEYAVTWIGRDGTRKTASGRDTLGLVFLDQVPN